MTRYTEQLLDFSLISDASEVDDGENKEHFAFTSNAVIDVQEGDADLDTDSFPCVSDVSSSSSKQVRFEEDYLTFTVQPQSTNNVTPEVRRLAFNSSDDRRIPEDTQRQLADPSITLNAQWQQNSNTLRDNFVTNVFEHRILSECSALQEESPKSFQPKPCTFFSESSDSSVNVTTLSIGDHLPRLLKSYSAPTTQPFVSPEAYNSGVYVPDSEENTTRVSYEKFDQAPKPALSITNRAASATNWPMCSSLAPDQIDWSKPSLHTTKHLVYQIKEISKKLASGSLSDPEERARREAARLVAEACGGSSQNNTESLVLNPGLTVNIPEQECIFNNLMELSVDESEIVRQERERVANQRKRMAELRKKAAKQKPVFPAPDLLEFFDPNQHVFQSVNLHVRDLPSFLPSAHRASDDGFKAIHERMVADFSRINP